MGAERGLGGRCAFCRDQLKGEAVVAQDRLWHPEHFTCSSCEKPLKQTFQENEGKVYCAQCYAINFNPKCFACNEGIEGEAVWAMKRNWHTKCFVCATCGKSFDKGHFYVVKGQAYDLDCHWAKKLQLTPRDL